MAFSKVGSPQPISVLNDMCQVCGKNKAEFNVNGKLVCGTCKAILESNKTEPIVQQ